MPQQGTHQALVEDPRPAAVSSAFPSNVQSTSRSCTAGQSGDGASRDSCRHAQRDTANRDTVNLLLAVLAVEVFEPRGRNLYLMWEGKRLEINLCSLTCRSRFCQVHRPQLGARTARALSEFCSCAHLHCAPLSPPPKCRADDWLLAQPSCPLAKPSSPPPLVLSPPLW